MTMVSIYRYDFRMSVNYSVVMMGQLQTSRELYSEDDPSTIWEVTIPPKT